MCSMFAYAQNTMVVHTKNGTTKFQIEELDSITFVTDAELDQTPESTITEENVYNDENNVKLVIYGIYSSLAQYINLQKQVEEIYCLPLLSEEGQVYSLFAYDRNISELWNAGYQTINRANATIKALTSMDADYTKEALSHALVIRSFVYYNMSMLWGTIPYVDENVNVENYESQISVMTQSNVLQKMLDENITTLYNYMRNGSAFLDDEHRMFEYGSLQVLLSEMQLTCKNLTEAAILLNGEVQTFNAYFASNPDSGYCINVYTDNFINNLKNETRGQADWPITTSDYYWGAWAAHKRTGLAEKRILELHPELKYRLLLPIPENELNLNMKLKQNEGYDTQTR